MTAKCKLCKKTWNVSVQADIPKEGYICPRCYLRKLKKENRATEVKKSIIKQFNKLPKVLLKNKNKYRG